MIEISVRATIYRPLPRKPGLGWGKSTHNILCLSIYIDTRYSITLHLGLYVYISISMYTTRYSRIREQLGHYMNPSGAPISGCLRRFRARTRYCMLTQSSTLLSRLSQTLDLVACLLLHTHLYLFTTTSCIFLYISLIIYTISCGTAHFPPLPPRPFLDLVYAYMDIHYI